MELNFAASNRGECGSSQTGDLAQEFFQGFLVFRSNVFWNDVFWSGCFRRQWVRR